MPANKLLKPTATAGGQERSVPVYFEGQNCNIPDHYVTASRADELKDTGVARPINRGKALMMKRPVAVWRPRETAAVAVRETVSVKSRWAIVGQTKLPYTDMHSLGVLDERLSTPDEPVYRKPAPGPGCPRYALV